MNSIRKRTMSMADKLQALESAGFAIRVADPRAGHANGYVSWSGVVDSGHAEPTDRPYVDLGSVARGDDRFDQTSTWERSNFRSLIRDFPGLFVPTSYSNVDSLGVFVHDLNGATLEMLIGLKDDYPIYDESDLSELEYGEISEAFDQYLFSDWRNGAAEEWTDVADLFTPDRWDAPSEVRDAFYAAMSESGYFPEHDGHDVRWDDSKVQAAMEAALTRLVAETFGARTPDTTEPLF